MEYNGIPNGDSNGHFFNSLWQECLLHMQQQYKYGYHLLTFGLWNVDTGSDNDNSQTESCNYVARKNTREKKEKLYVDAKRG